MRVDELKVTSGIRALILDFGGVLTRDQPYHLVEEMARLAGLPIDDFQSRYWRHRGDYDGGLTGLEYWTRVLDGVDAPPDTIEQLIEVDAASWSDSARTCGSLLPRSGLAAGELQYCRTACLRSSPAFGAGATSKRGSTL
jgi:hypothetical protein